MDFQTIRKLMGTELFMVFLTYLYFRVTYPSKNKYEIIGQAKKTDRGEEEMEMISSNSDKRQPTSPQNSKPEIIYTIANSLLQLFCHHAVAIVCCIRMPTTVLLNYSWIHFLAYVVYIFFSIGKDVKLMRVLALAGMYYINCFVLIKHEMLRIWY